MTSYPNRQSSTYSNLGKAEHAIDGNSDPEWKHYSCSSTAYETKPWWRLELPGVYRVSEIQVTNRNAKRKRLNSVEIFIGNSLVNNGNDNPRCAIINDDPGCLTQTVKCWGMAGRFINLYRSFDVADALTFCEVKVYGEPAAPSMSIQKMGRNITIVGTRLCWSDALLYCRDSHWDLLSLIGPEDQEMIDELVARATFPLTSQLWVGLRRSPSGSSWFWMSGDPMDFTRWDEGSHHSSLCGGTSSQMPYFPPPPDTGRGHIRPPTHSPPPERERKSATAIGAPRLCKTRKLKGCNARYHRVSSR
ncbi:uncharacterized protein LOC130377594 [Gadus chalcogrammus]|uniref:uncharacterized protein LOC130377594 n=1 Tax=Gadus chalcogrammus TaxID=1042646 RepID=UPI0024C4A5EC|nr:uncharacterized protein LOC130377594 [Gadus chalcogrammus]